MRRILLAAMFAVTTTVAMGGAARADGDIPPPPTTPGQGGSPGTGQTPPSDPSNPGQLPPPSGTTCNSDPTQSCDPSYPADPGSPQPGNTPGDGWYNDIYNQFYYFQQSVSQLQQWGAQYDSSVYYYAEWLHSVMFSYYSEMFSGPYQPISYSWGRPTRGDFNYVFYYWVRPIYINILQTATSYYSNQYQSGYPNGGYSSGNGGYSSGSNSNGYQQYQKVVSQMASTYHSLTRCEYGFMGTDKNAKDDAALSALEAKAGITPTAAPAR